LAQTLTDTEKRQALLVFDFFSVMDHAHHAMTEGIQDFFIEITLDAEYITREFSYADDLEDAAKEKKRQR
jgi:hypothetical protein